MEETLKKIEENTKKGSSYLLTLSGKGSMLEKTFQPEIIGGCDYKLAFTSLDTYYSVPNIDSSNNTLEISHNDGLFLIIPLDKGCYSLDDLDKEIRRQLKVLKMDDAVQFIPEYTTFRCVMKIKETYKVKFGDNSLASVLGFEKKVYIGRKERYVSEHTVQIMYINSILIHCDLVGNSYLNGTPTPIIHSFFPSVNPGEKIIERPVEHIYLPVDLDVIRHMRVWLTDQNLSLLDLGEEEVTIKFHLTCC